MAENKQIEISLKTVLIILFIIAVLIIGIIVTVKYAIRKNETPNTDGVNQTGTEENYIYNGEIKSIAIKYYQGYNIATGEIIDIIPLNTIKLKSNDLNEVSKLIRDLTKVKCSEDDEMYEHIVYDNICDEYKLEINDDFIICIGERYGVVDEKEDYFEVPEELYNKILEITKKYNEDNLYKKINSEKITIISNQEKLEVTDEEQLNELSNYQYYVINAPDEEFENEEVIYTLDLNDGRKIDIYFASVLSCIYYEDETHEYIYTGKLENYIKEIFENSREN